MKVSLSWLSDHIDIGSIGLNIFEISEALTFSGVEIEKIYGLAKCPENIVLGRIVSFSKHPNADKLSVCEVMAYPKDTNLGSECLQIICGANNFKKNDLVATALPGADLGNNFIIKKSKIRGVESSGMLCSEEELGLAAKSDGIMILNGFDEKKKLSDNIGEPINSIFQDEGSLDVEITSNRPDLLSHLGIARDLSAVLDTSLIGKNNYSKLKVKTTEALPEDILNDSDSLCKLYSKRKINNVKIADSPNWLQNKLKSVGLNPKNNVVDITNYVLLDMGQPLHAFDADKISGGIVIRKAKNGEEILALDNITYKLDPSILIIADDVKPLAIAGIIGGKNSAVSDTTKNIIVESAYFSSESIRRSSRKLGISTDSSYRFERKVDMNQVIGASERASELISELCDGEPEDKTYIAGQTHHDENIVELHYQKAKELIGSEITAGEIDNILNKFYLKRIDNNSSDTQSDNLTLHSEYSKWQIPSYRLDLTRHIDLVEEITRIYGTDKIPATFRTNFVKKNKNDANFDKIKKLKNYLGNNGFYEVQTIKLISENDIDDAYFLNEKERNSLAIVDNELNASHKILAPSLIPSLLKCAETNLKNNKNYVKFYESNKVFFKFNKNYIEKKVLTIISGGKFNPSKWEKNNVQDLDFFYLSGLISSYFSSFSFNIKTCSLKNIKHGGEIIIDGKKVGYIAEISDTKVSSLGFNFPLYVCEIEIDKCLKITEQTDRKRYTKIEKFPSVTRDISFSITPHITFNLLNNFFSQQVKKTEIMNSFEPFDLFHNKKDNSKSIAFSIKYLHPKRTLESSEVDQCHQKLCKELTSNFDIKIR